MVMTSGEPSETKTRRTFLTLLGRLGVGTAAAAAAWRALRAFGPLTADGAALAAVKHNQPVPARYYTRIKGTRDVTCRLCPHRETLRPGQTGICRGRQNIDGRLMTHAYGRPCVLNIDPIGKNPLAHFFPEMSVLALAHGGCNLGCLYCQNWQFSQESPTRTRNITPFDFKEVSGKMRARRLGGISFTYTEADYTPEFAMDFAEFCGRFDLKRTLCTAGYINSKPFRDLLRHFEAVTVTYKGPTNEFYRTVVKGTLQPVLDSMILARSEGKWLEVATLVVPALNDDRSSLTTMARWIRDNLGPDTPWHLERFEPQYKLRNLPPTAQKTLETARKIGLDQGLRFVYISNLVPHPGNHTYCPSCGRVLIKRMGFKVIQNEAAAACRYCGAAIPGVWG